MCPVRCVSRLARGGLSLAGVSGMVAAVSRRVGTGWSRRDMPPVRSSRSGLPRLGRRGSAAVEFALVVGPLMMLVFAGIAATALFFTWGAMQEKAQFAARMVSTDNVKNFANGPITLANTSSTSNCSSAPAGTVEYLACQGLPNWGTYTVTASEDCSVPSVTVSISIAAKSAAIVDLFSIFGEKNIVAKSVVMKELACP